MTFKANKIELIILVYKLKADGINCLRNYRGIISESTTFGVMVVDYIILMLVLSSSSSVNLLYSARVAGASPNRPHFFLLLTQTNPTAANKTANTTNTTITVGPGLFDFVF